MLNIRSCTRLPRFAAVVLAAVVLSGCGGVEIESKLLDNLGVTKALVGDNREKNVASRTGIIMPPNSDTLPTPGAGGTIATAPAVDPSFPVDPEVLAAHQKRQHAAALAEKCRGGNEKFGSRQGNKPGLGTLNQDGREDCGFALDEYQGDKPLDGSKDAN